MTVLADQIIPLANYPTGTMRIGFGPGQGGNPLLVPDTTKSCDIQVQRCTTATPTIWPNAATILETIPEISVDGGVTWIEAGRSKAGGGISFGKDGVTEIAFAASGGFLPVGTNRLYRCTFIIVNGPLRTSANVIVD
jgi:hypothetical protein